jgi:hypothetical protein
MGSPASAAALRQWIENMRTAEARDQQARREAPLSPAESLRRAGELLEFAKRLGTPPADDDEVRVRATWAALRRAWGVP